MAKRYTITLNPKQGQERKEVAIAFPSVKMTVQDFCEFFNRIDEVVDFWYEHNRDRKLYRIIKDFLELIDIPEGLPSKYPDFFDAECVAS